MRYIKSNNLGDYGGLASFPDIPNVKTFKLPQTPQGSYIQSKPWRGVYTFSPYIGMRPPPPLFGKDQSIYKASMSSFLEPEIKPMGVPRNIKPWQPPFEIKQDRKP